VGPSRRETDGSRATSASEQAVHEFRDVAGRDGSLNVGNVATVY
jgi:hypothetical protein